MPNVGFQSQSQAERVAASTRFIEQNGITWASEYASRNNGGLQCIFAKLTSRDATNKTLYAWSQVRTNATGTFSVVSGGLSGTTSVQPAILLDITAASGADLSADATTQYVALARGTYDASGTPAPCFIILEFGGYTGTDTRWGQVTWDGTTLKQDSTTVVYVDGHLISVTVNSPTTIDTSTDCSGM